MLKITKKHAILLAVMEVKEFDYIDYHHYSENIESMYLYEADTVEELENKL